jgi:hypothetical protein
MAIVEITAQPFQALPQNYWDRPKRAAAGDPDVNEIFRAVGNASTNWEGVEYAFSRLFMTLVESQSDAPGRAYGAIATSTGRRDMLTQAADAFIKKFGDHPGDRESTYSLIQNYSKANSRRVDIIHATVAQFDNLGHYLIVPLYSSRKRRPLTIADIRKLDPLTMTQTEYAFVSTDIVSFCDKFAELFQSVFCHQEYLWQKYLLPRQPPGDVPAT